MAEVTRLGGAAVVLVGIPAGMYYVGWAMWEGGPSPWAGLLFLAIGATHWALFPFLVKEAAPLALVLMFLNISWILLFILRSDMSEDQRMHDQGVTEQAVVTEWIRTSDPMSGIRDQVTSIGLKLPDGGGPRLELKGAHPPAGGSTVQVTRDPRGDVPIRLGPRPGAPGGVLATITLVVVLGTSLTLSTAAAAFVKDR
ncbi:hypothetical protein ACFXPI_27790 [Streptomyces sp. NPDC059104]|uniref:hypothetical protein n=1 Tax=Streptomyces sp. NPDC059104 TaxID=3346729 RepID=UPI0036AF4097